MRDRLHITNGDSSAELIRQVVEDEEIVSWRDVLHEGPVPDGFGFAELSRARARFLLGADWTSSQDAREHFQDRDGRLEAFREADEVVLWFEHDLYDQLQLLQVLDFFAGQNLAARRLSLICDAEFLGHSTVDRLAERFDLRDDVKRPQIDLAVRAWASFRSPDPTAISKLIVEDTSALPFLASALARHLEQFPSTTNGLSRSEQQLLSIVESGTVRLKDVFRESQILEEAEFLGDSVFATYVARLGDVPHPLLLFGDGRIIQVLSSPGPEFWNAPLQTTEMGRAVLKDDEDHIARNGIDRWLGGVHLTTENVWRWNPTSRIVEPDRRQRQAR